MTPPTWFVVVRMRARLHGFRACILLGGELARPADPSQRKYSRPERERERERERGENNRGNDRERGRPRVARDSHAKPRAVSRGANARHQSRPVHTGTTPKHKLWSGRITLHTRARTYFSLGGRSAGGQPFLRESRRHQRPKWTIPLPLSLSLAWHVLVRARPS